MSQQYGRTHNGLKRVRGTSDRPSNSSLSGTLVDDISGRDPEVTQVKERLNQNRWRGMTREGTQASEERETEMVGRCVLMN